MFVIYKTTNKKDGKIYIGFHSIEKDSIISEKTDTGSIFASGYMGSGKHLVRAISKYGPENFKQELIEKFVNKEDAEKLERELVNEEFVNRSDTYNLSLGGNVCILYGDKNGFYGKKHSAETLEIMKAKRQETYEKNSYSSSEIIEVSTDKKFLNGREVSVYLGIEYSRMTILELVYDGYFKYKNENNQKRAIESYKKYLDFMEGSEERLDFKRALVSKRFKGVPKSEESNKKRGKSIKEWIQNNPEEHTSRMEKINKNPEKIRKTADKHRGMKRSEESRKKMSEKAKGRPADNKNKIWIHNTTSFDRRYIEKNDQIPEGWSKGMGRRKT
jgi:hypothetical protein